MQKDLNKEETIFRQIPFPIANLAIALVPNIMADQFFRHAFALNDIVNLRNDDVFIMGTVENGNFSAPRQGFIDTPQIIMILFFHTRLFKAVHVYAGRIHTRKNVLYRAVFAGCIHGLQDDDDTIVIISTQLFLPVVHFCQHLGHFFILDLLFVQLLHIAACRKLGQINFFSLFYAVARRIHTNPS